MSKRIKKFRASDEYPMSVLVDYDGIPLFYPNVYVNTQFRSLGYSDNSIEKILRSIGMLYLWAEQNKLDLDKLLFSSSFLSISQLENIAFFLRLKREEQNALRDKQKINPKNISRKFEKIIYKNNKGSLPSVSALEGSYRIRTVSNYFKFCISRSKYRSISSKPNDFESRIAIFQSLAPRVINKGDQDALEGLSKSAMKKIYDIFNPSNPNNPFQKDFHKYRNELMFEFFIKTGIRRNELRNIKLDDVSYTDNTLDIRVSKTKPRTVPLSKELSIKFHNFVIKQLAKIPPKERKHNYLFTTSKGKHISNDAINLVIRTAQKASAIEDINLTPHTFRRTWNDSFSELIDSLPPEKKISEEAEKNIRNRLMGWSSNSTMSATYAKRSIREKTDELANLLAEQINVMDKGE